ncbi:TPA: hypothetical protein U1U91_000685 [Streptococcus suis]|nr:hypothetical protein [Streptococcus suis]HEM3871630.1 hypothetical protein [Streptococcus suis]
MSGTIDNVIFDDMKKTFYDYVTDNGISLSELPSYDPFKVIQSMFMVIENGGTDQSWQLLLHTLVNALTDHNKLSEKNLVDKVEYLILRKQSSEYDCLKKALKTALEE